VNLTPKCEVFLILVLVFSLAAFAHILNDVVLHVLKKMKKESLSKTLEPMKSKICDVTSVTRDHNHVIS